MLKPWGRWVAKTKNPYLKRIWRRVYERNQNYIAYIYGPPGTSKSWDGLSLGEMLSPRFSVKYVVFSVEQLFALIKQPWVVVGDVILFEEAGVAVSNREYNSERNQLLSKLTQVFRTKNIILLYNSPKTELADKQILCVCMGLIMTSGIDYDTSEGICRIYDPVRYDMKRGTWSKRLIGVKRRSPINPNRFWSLKIGTTRIKRPSVKLVHEYEKLRFAYTENMINEGDATLTKIVAREKSGPVKTGVTRTQITAWADEVITFKEDYMDETRFNLALVQNRFEVSTQTAKRIKAEVRSKMEKLSYSILWR